ncbi:MAG: single-stranded DNA-binding protein [Lentimicrobiaceae bacterium]|jgi:single-strand DNA-binding protein|nr:single-stranded DNA-binding protein [Lentimicrobiaceae bacterium]MCP4911306.1 single-stranded DNA-binding protein [Bacteroidota bacterium]MBT3454036.1 single-stranded DNA-binding protein [Lentimicrobiaceae bacterium]MBT3819154.1 single-stranded DNA-binding protein [Lentimicrobiaceae bacterium]MBT4060583.1 single-stranded DNA-binding protein [Lentimicrobiaceae bacterium]
MTTLRNSVQLIGRLGIDPETKTIGEDRLLAKFSLATNDYFRDKNGDRQESTQWHNIVTFGKTAEVAEKYLKRGNEIAIGGKLSYNSWEDKEGKTHYMTEIIATEILMLGNKK